MKKLYVVVIVLLLAGFCQAQEKVGTNPGFYELLLSPSVVSRGMGNTGVALANEGSFYHNPASIGMTGLDYRFAGYVYPSNVDLFTDVRYFSWGDVASIVLSEGSNSRSVLAFGSAYSHIKIGPIQETTYEYPDGTGNYFEPTMKNLSMYVSFARRTTWYDFSVGTTVKLVKEEIFATNADAVTADIGAALAVPLGQFLSKNNSASNLIVTPSVGFSFSNLFGSFDYGGGFSFDSTRPTGVLISYDLPSYTRYGGGLKLGLANKLQNGNNLELVALLGALDRFTIEDYDPEYDRGVELSILELFSYRRGSFLDAKTVGMTIETTGLNKMLFKKNSSGFTGFLQRVTVSFSYAKSDADYIINNNSKYYNLGIGFLM